MSSSVFRVAVLLVVGGVTGLALQSQSDSSSWPPALQSVPDGPAPVLSPAEEMQTFFLPPGYRVELVASEPLIQDPVNFDFDPAGRMWLIEMPGYMSDVRASDELEPTGRIVVLEDLDKDGRMDKRTVFADGLVLPRAIKKYGGVDPDALRKAALEVDLPEGGTMLGYGVKFYGEGTPMAGQNERSFPVVIQYIDEKSYVVWPKSQAQREAVLPLPAGSTYSYK